MLKNFFEKPERVFLYKSLLKFGCSRSQSSKNAKTLKSSIDLKRISIIVFSLTSIACVLTFVHYFTIQRQLESPFIPQSIGDSIKADYLRIGIILFVCCFISFLLLWRKKYAISIALCALTFVYCQYFVGRII